MIIGHQIKYVTKVLEAKKRPLDLGEDSSNKKNAEQILRERSKVYMQMAVSVVVLIGGLFVLLVSKDPGIHKYFSALLGAVVGYWLR